MKHTISVLLQNKPGVLSRVTGLFSGRGFNIESLCVAETLEPEVSCLTVVSRGDEAIIEQITKQLLSLSEVGSHERTLLRGKVKAHVHMAVKDEIRLQLLHELDAGIKADPTPEKVAVPRAVVIDPSHRERIPRKE